MAEDDKNEVQVQATIPPERSADQTNMPEETAQHFLSRSDKVEISSREAEKSKKKPSVGSNAMKAMFEQSDIELSAFLPNDIIGGSVPYIAGMESETVWNAASQACGTERIHYCYTVDGDRCWYFATPSASLASAPDSWCPLTAALPGNSEHWDKDTVYIYEQEGMAGALRWDNETGRMQAFVGASRTILPRIQSLEANFVTIDPEKAKQVAWHNRSLNREKLSRSLMRMTFFSGLSVTIVALLIWVLSFAFTAILEPELKEAESLTRDATFNLMIEATKALNTDVNKHFYNLRRLMDTLPKFGGTLLKYEIIDGGSAEWEALVPRALEGDISQFKAKAIGLEKGDGRLRIRGKH